MHNPPVNLPHPRSTKGYLISGIFLLMMAVAFCAASGTIMLVLGVMGVAWTVFVVVGQWTVVPLGNPLVDWLWEVVGFGESIGG